MTFEEWMKYGQDQGYCSPRVCATHDGIPTTLLEELEWEDGGDPCITIIRPYMDAADKEAVEQNFAAFQWRD